MFPIFPSFPPTASLSKLDKQGEYPNNRDELVERARCTITNHCRQAYLPPQNNQFPFRVRPPLLPPIATQTKSPDHPQTRCPLLPLLPKHSSFTKTPQNYPIPNITHVLSHYCLIIFYPRTPKPAENPVQNISFLPIET